MRTHVNHCEICGKALRGGQTVTCSGHCSMQYVTVKARSKITRKARLKSYNGAVTLPKLTICEDQMGAEIYSVKNSSHPGIYTFTKFDQDLNPLTNYLVSSGECNCPRGEIGKQCRHRDMLRGFLKTKHIDDGWMWNHSTQQWIKPPAAIEAALDERAGEPNPSPAPTPAPEPQVLASAPAVAAVNGAGVSFRKRRW